MTHDARHRRANEEQVRQLREHLAGRPPRRASRLPTLLWGLACLAALATYILLGHPLVPLLVACTVILAVDRVLTHDGRSLPVRWTASLTAGVIVLLALWRG